MQLSLDRRISKELGARSGVSSRGNETVSMQTADDLDRDTPVNKEHGPRRPDTWPLARREPRVAATNMQPGKSNSDDWWRPALSSGRATSNQAIRPRDERYGYYAVACVLGSLSMRACHGRLAVPVSLVIHWTKDVFEKRTNPTYLPAPCSCSHVCMVRCPSKCYPACMQCSNPCGSSFVLGRRSTTSCFPVCPLQSRVQSWYSDSH